MENQRKFYLIFTCWIIASVSTLGSLFFSEIMLFPPCSLCWYQRIFMYPLVILFIPSMLQVDRSVVRFTLPMSIVGFLLALYHNLLHWGVVPESAAPCREGVSCSTIYLDWFGFVTIPLMSLISFSIIILLLLSLNRMFKNEK